ncbi:MAG: ATP-binding protein [Campylobacterota bacterium]
MMNLLYPYRHYLVVIVLFAVITAVSRIFTEQLEMINIVLIHLLPVIVIALRGSMAATIAVTTLSVALLALYIPPTLSFVVHDFIYLWSFAIFYAVGYIITVQARRIHINSIKEILLDTLSHDLKTPLASIMGNATFLVETHTTDPAVRYKALSQIIESSRRMNRLISNLLDSARLQHSRSPLKKEWCDMEDLVAIAVREFRKDAWFERLRCRFDADLPLFYGDAGLLVRLFVNLMDNALKYSDEDKPIAIDIKATSRAFYIAFSNECPPINEEHLHHLFDKFYRAGNSADISGSGIGLSICRDIALAHQGRIRAYNTPNGVSFEVTLPILRHPEPFEAEVA